MRHAMASGEHWTTYCLLLPNHGSDLLENLTVTRSATRADLGPIILHLAMLLPNVAC